MSDHNPWPRASIELDAGHVSYHRTGGKKPIAILVHGLTDNSLCWTRVAQALSQTFDVIMLDSPGHGHSAMPDEPAELDAFDAATSIAGLIQALKISEPIIIGHSIGAIAAAEFACAHPNIPAQVILEDPPYRRRTPTTLSAEQLNGFKKDTAKLKAMSLRDLIAMAKQQYPDWHELDLAPWAEAKHQVAADILGHYRFKPWRDSIDGIVSPTLLLFGAPGNDGIVTPDIAQAIAETNPAIQTIQVDGAGHQIHRTHFETYMTLIERFLNANP